MVQEIHKAIESFTVQYMSPPCLITSVRLKMSALAAFLKQNLKGSQIAVRRVVFCLHRRIILMCFLRKKTPVVMWIMWRSLFTVPSRFEIDETSPSMSGCCGDDCSYEILSRRTKHGEASAGHTHGGGHCGGCCHWFGFLGCMGKLELPAGFGRP